jgi:hypothetical protein
MADVRTQIVHVVVYDRFPEAPEIMERSPVASLTFALPVSFPAFRRRILNVVNAGSGERAWVKTLPLV